MKEIILFIVTFIIIFIVYYLLLKEKKNKKKKKKQPMEIKFLIDNYHLDMKKINYKKLVLLVSLVNAFDISLLITIIGLVKSTILKIILVVLLVFPIVIISYSLIGKYYKKKGMTKDES